MATPFLFINYRRKDTAVLADSLSTMLRDAFGDDVVFLDSSNIETGKVFPDQIQQALDRCTCMLVLIGEKWLLQHDDQTGIRRLDMQEDWVRREIESALQRGINVIPVLAPGAKLPTRKALPASIQTLADRIAMSLRSDSYYLDRSALLEELAANHGFVHFTGSASASPTAVSDSSTGTRLGVPERPAHFRPRKELFVALRDIVLNTTKPVGIPVGVYGMGGTGKSVLAAELARDEQVGKAFPGGVFWLTVGQQPVIVTLQIQLANWLGDPAPVIDSERAGKQRLQQLFDHRRCLLILDDIWDFEHFQAFSSLGETCCIIITTRDATILTKAAARELPVEQLSEFESLALLADWAGQNVNTLPSEATEVAGECGNLPLAIAICGAMIHDGNSWNDLLESLREADLSYLDESVGYPYQDVLRSLEASVTALAVANDAHATRYQELAVFPQDANVPEAAVAILWQYTGKMQQRDVRKLLTQLQRKCLLRLEGEPPNRRLSLHDLQFDYLSGRTADLTGLHEKLIEAYRTNCGAAWWEEADDGYFFGHLPFHLQQAARSSELKALLLDARWLEAWLQATNVSTMVDTVMRLGNDDAPLLSKALRMSSHVLSRDAEQLRTQVFGRLMECVSTTIVQACQETKKSTCKHPWFAALTPSLTQVKSAQQLTLQGHSSGVTAVAITPEGKVVSTSDDDTLKVWDLPSGELEQTLEGHWSSVNAVAITIQGKAVSASSDYTLAVWDLESGELERTLAGHSGGVNAVAITRDGRAVSASFDQTLKVWDLESGELERTFAGHKRSVTAVVITPEQKAISTSEDRTLKVWDLATGQLERTLKGHKAAVTAVAIMPEGKLVSASRDATLKVWDVATGKLTQTLKGHEAAVTAVVITPDGKAVSASEDATLKVWDLATGKLVRTLKGHNNWVTAVTITPKGKAVSASEDATLKVWDLASGQLEQTLEGHSESIVAVAVAPTGEAISASEDATLKVWDLSGGQPSRKAEGHKGCVTALVVTPTGKAVSASDDGTLNLWDLDSGQPEQTLKGHSASVLAVAITLAGKVVSASSDHTLKVWNLVSGELECTLEGHKGLVTAVAITPNGKAVSVSNDQTLKVWNLDNGQLERTLKGHRDWINVVAITPEGKAISTSIYGGLNVWDLETGKLDRRLRGHSGWVTAVAITQDGKTISAFDDGTLEVWDLDRGRLECTLEGHRYSVNAVVITPEGKAVSASFDNTLKVWDLCRDRPERILNGHTASVNAVAITEDENVLTASNDATLKVWDLTSGEAAATFTGEAPLTAIAAAPDDVTVVGDSMGRVHILQLISPR